MMVLKETYIKLLRDYTKNDGFINVLWSEIENNYTNSDRHYHNIQHLEQILLQLNEIKSAIQNWPAMLFSLYYHDIIYDPLSSDNEINSAELAEKRLHESYVNIDTIELCNEHIKSTKSHQTSTNSDTNYFLDADLSILGQAWEAYSFYIIKIRKEYAIYLDEEYISGRKKVLNHFLSMKRIFKTDYFYKKFETQARKNIQKELDMLS